MSGKPLFHMKWGLATDEVPWSRRTGDATWASYVYNWPITFTRKSPYLAEKVKEFHLATYEGPWSREGLTDHVYNGPAFESRILSDDEIINRSARTGRNPLVWQYTERAFARYWDQTNNSTNGALFLSMLCDEIQEILEVDVDRLPLAQRVASEMFSWLGSPTGIQFAVMTEARSIPEVLEYWDSYNNFASNAYNPLLARLLSGDTKKRIKHKPDARVVEITAASVIVWLVVRGALLVQEIASKAQEEASKTQEDVKKFRLLMQSSGELPPPSEYEKLMIE